MMIGLGLLPMQSHITLQPEEPLSADNSGKKHGIKMHSMQGNLVEPQMNSLSQRSDKTHNLSNFNMRRQSE